MPLAIESRREAFDDADFVGRWRALYDACPWATGFQDAGFVAAWFAAYSEQFEPAIAAQTRDGDGRLEALLILARDRRDGSLLTAGANQAEYQPWLARPELDQAAFLTDALQALDARELTLAFLADDVPLDAIEASPLGRRIALRTDQTPLLRRLDGAAPKLRGRTFKSKLNRLKRLGAIALSIPEEPAARRAILDWAAPRYDLRQASQFGGFPFADDPRKTDFHRRLMELEPARFHVAALTLDDQPIAAHLGVRGRRRLRLGILAHDAGLARHSPGVVLLTLLAERILEEGAELDLTPGDDPWKLRLANDREDVRALVLYPSALARDAAALKARVKSGIKSAAGPLLRRLRERPDDDAAAAKPMSAEAIPCGAAIEDLVALARSQPAQARGAAASQILERLSAGEPAPAS